MVKRNDQLRRLLDAFFVLHRRTSRLLPVVDGDRIVRKLDQTQH